MEKLNWRAYSISLILNSSGFASFASVEDRRKLRPREKVHVRYAGNTVNMERQLHGCFLLAQPGELRAVKSIALNINFLNKKFIG